MKFKLGDLFSKIILAIGAILTGFLAFSNFFVYGHLESNSTEYMYILKNGFTLWIGVAVFAVILWLLNLVFDSISEVKLFLICLFLFVIVSVFIIFNVPDTIRGDAYMIYKYASKFLKGDYEGLTGGYYLRFFPYQLGMVTYEMGLLSIWNSTKILFIANMLFAIGTNFSMWKISDLLFGSDRQRKMVIVLSFGFAPALFYILFTYGSVPGHFFITAAGVFLIRHIKRKGRLNWLLCALCLGTAIIFKPNYIIAAMAAAIVLFIYALSQKEKINYLICIGTFLISIMMNVLFLNMWRNISGVDFDGGAPYVLNVVMGMMPKEQGTGRLGGWYNGYNYSTFEENGYSVAASKEAAAKKAGELLEYWADEDNSLILFFRDKIWSTWCDPLFGSLWAGPLEDSDQYVENRLLHSVFTGGHAAIFIGRYMNAFMVIVYALTAFYCLRNFFAKSRKRNGAENLFFILVFIGGFIFHLFSETKSQYVYMYAYGLILYAAGSFKENI